jgi:hypothetical protein
MPALPWDLARFYPLRVWSLARFFRAEGAEGPSMGLRLTWNGRNWQTEDVRPGLGAVASLLRMIHSPPETGHRSNHPRRVPPDAHL